MSSKVKLISAPPWMLADLWPKVGGLLLKGVLSSGETDPEFVVGDLKDCADRIVDGRSQLWLVLHEGPHKVLAAFCSTILLQPDGTRIVHIHTLAGEAVRTWGHLVAPAIDDFAKAEGARSVTYEGRRAWSRVLPADAIRQADGVTTFERVLQ